MVPVGTTKGADLLITMRNVMRFEMTVAEWLGTALMLAAPYLLVGMVWTALHSERLDSTGPAAVVSIVGSVACWPALVFSSACVA